MKSILRQNALNIVSALGEHNLYVNRSDMTLGDKPYNSAALLGTAVAIAGASALLTGDPGIGKTTSAERIGSLTYGLPEDFILAAEIHGAPEQTEEKMIVRPDLGALNRGEESVVWNYFVPSPVKILDEINRLPETKQSVLLNGIDRRVWSYLNSTERAPPGVVFATMNYADRGTGTVLPPLADRFAISYESKHMGPNFSWALATDTSDNGDLLKNHEIAEKMKDAIRDKSLGFTEKIEILEKLSEETAKHFKDTLGAGMSMQERLAARKEIDGVTIDPSGDADLFARYFLAMTMHSYEFGQIRSNERPGEGSHGKNYLSNSIENPASQRLAKSLALMSKTIAWLDGQEEVGMDHMMTVAPYVIAHRARFAENYIKANHDKDSSSKDYKQLRVAKAAVKEVAGKFTEDKTDVRNLLSEADELWAMERGPRRNEAMEILAKKLGKKDAPFFHQLAMDLV